MSTNYNFTPLTGTHEVYRAGDNTKCLEDDSLEIEHRHFLK